jgi:hypothetical protein
MSKDLGTVRPGSTIYIEFDSFGASGESLTLSGLATSDVEVFKNGGTTQRASDSGYSLLDTDGIDFDGITGIHGLSINLADNTTAGFWEAGAHYRVVISSVTINSQTVSFTAATFRIGYEGAIINTSIATLSSQTSFTLTAGPAEDDALNGMWCIIHDVASAVQCGRGLILDYTGSTKTVTLAAGTTFTAAAGDNISIMGMVPLQPATIGRTLVVDAAGLADANMVKLGPSGSGTAQTARDIGAALPAAAPGASGGLLIAGNNAATTFTAGLVISQSQTDYAGLEIYGNGTGPGVAIAGGTTGNGVNIQTNDGDALFLFAETDGNAINAIGAGSGLGFSVNTTNIDEPIASAVQALFVDNSGTAQAGASGTITLASGASSTDDFYNGAVVKIQSGAGAGQSRRITDYVGSTRVATVDSNWVTNPDNTSVYIVLGRII